MTRKNTMNTQPIPQSTLPVTAMKPTFFNVFALYDFDYTILELIATMAGVEQYIVNAMYTTVAIHRSDAAKILAAFSEYTQQTYNFDNVKVALHPTFNDIVEAHKLDTSIIATESGIPLAIVDMMLCNEPVSAGEASLALQTASNLSRHIFTLENVDVQLVSAETN